MAQEENLDLVEIAANAQPPVVKIIEYKKFKYLEEKKQKEARKHTKETELKEVRFSPFIGQHDLETGLKKVRSFLSEGNLVKISIVFKGRQMAHQEFGPKLLDRILVELATLAEKEREGRFEGRRFVTFLKPKRDHQPQNRESHKEKPDTLNSKKETNNNNEAKN